MHEKEYVSSRVQPAPWKPRHLCRGARFSSLAKRELNENRASAPELFHCFEGTGFQSRRWKPRDFGLNSLSVSSEFNAREGVCLFESATSTVEAPDFRSQVSFRLQRIQCGRRSMWSRECNHRAEAPDFGSGVARFLNRRETSYIYEPGFTVC
jgi:hypothetical protein